MFQLGSEEEELKKWEGGAELVNVCVRVHPQTVECWCKGSRREQGTEPELMRSYNYNFI